MSYKSNSWFLRNAIGEKSPSVLVDALKDSALRNDKGEVVSIDLQKFASAVPTQQMNEFLSEIVNKIVLQRVFNLTDGAVFPYLDFQKADNEYGDAIELVAVENLPMAGNDYAETCDLSPNVPKVNTQYIYTTDKKFWKVSILPQVMKRAIITEGQLGALIGVIVGRLEFAYNMYLYTKISSDLKGITGQTITLPSLGVASTTEDAKKYLSTCIQVALKMSQFNTIFNSEGMTSITPKGSAILCLNAATFASLNVDALASLLNSDKLDLKVFKDIRLVDFYNADGTKDTTTLGYLLDKDFYMFYVPIKENTSFYCPSSLITTYWLHAWVKRGYAPFKNAVRFVASAGTLDANIE